MAISPRPEQQARILPTAPVAPSWCALSCSPLCSQLSPRVHRRRASSTIRRSIAAPAEARKGDHRSQIDRALGHKFRQGSCNQQRRPRCVATIPHVKKLLDGGAHGRPSKSTSRPLNRSSDRVYSPYPGAFRANPLEAIKHPLSPGKNGIV